MPSNRSAVPAVRTHRAIDRRLCGEPLEVGDGSATVAFTAMPEMAADDRGLVHGGFVFGCADFAAMLAVNEPNVVLSAAEATFLKPVVVGESLVARARVEETSGLKSEVKVEVRRGEVAVFAGRFRCVTLPRHVLDREAAP